MKEPWPKLRRSSNLLLNFALAGRITIISEMIMSPIPDGAMSLTMMKGL